MNGIIIVDKPEDFTSFDVIAKLRGILKERKLGHGGTLDPMATGVLPVFAGTATRAADLAPRTDKRYTATVQLGFSTDTGDITGSVTAKDDIVCRRGALEAVLPRFTGKIEQLPPMYSAVKIDGQRLYKLARQGKTAERNLRGIEIFKLEILNYCLENAQFTIDVHCSKGTYIRTLAEDIAKAAGCLGALCALRRTMSAGFGQAEAHTLSEIETKAKSGKIEDIILPVERLFDGYDRVCLDAKLARLFLNGVAFETSRIGKIINENNTVTVYREEVFLGLAQNVKGAFRKTKQFFSDI